MSRNFFIVVLLTIGSFSGWGQVDTIADQKLQEVVIMAKLPTVEMKPGKMTYRLDASITQSQGNVYDVLTNLPGVVIQNYTLSLHDALPIQIGRASCRERV